MVERAGSKIHRERRTGRGSGLRTTGLNYFNVLREYILSYIKLVVLMQSKNNKQEKLIIKKEEEKEKTHALEESKCK